MDARGRHRLGRRLVRGAAVATCPLDRLAELRLVEDGHMFPVGSRLGWRARRGLRLPDSSSTPRLVASRTGGRRGRGGGQSVHHIVRRSLISPQDLHFKCPTLRFGSEGVLRVFALGAAYRQKRLGVS